MRQPSVCPPATDSKCPVHTGRGAPGNRRTQIMKHIVVNGSIHTACKQHQMICMQICTQMYLPVLCERALVSLLTKLPQNKHHSDNFQIKTRIHTKCGGPVGRFLYKIPADFVWNVFIFPKMLLLLQSQKMPNQTNTWGLHPIFVEKITWKLPNHKRNPAKTSSSKFPAVTCPAGKNTFQTNMFPQNFQATNRNWSWEPNQKWSKTQIFALSCACLISWSGDAHKAFSHFLLVWTRLFFQLLMFLTEKKKFKSVWVFVHFLLPTWQTTVAVARLRTELCVQWLFFIGWVFSKMFFIKLQLILDVSVGVVWCFPTLPTKKKINRKPQSVSDKLVPENVGSCGFLWAITQLCEFSFSLTTHFYKILPSLHESVWWIPFGLKPFQPNNSAKCTLA